VTATKENIEKYSRALILHSALYSHKRTV